VGDTPEFKRLVELENKRATIQQYEKIKAAERKAAEALK
jgi:hypothetical protein